MLYLHEDFMKKEYTIAELEKLTGFSRRTIHFYIKEGVILPPGSVGAGAKYGEEHLLRLKMTALLQKRDMKLSGIRKILDTMSLEEMKGTVEEEESKTAYRGLAGIFEGGYLLRSESLPLQYYTQKNDPRAFSEEGFLKNKTVMQVSETEFREYPGNPTEKYPKESPEKTEETDSIETWRHIELTNGVQMNIREDIFHKYRSLILEMMKKFKEQ